MSTLRIRFTCPACGWTATRDAATADATVLKDDRCADACERVLSCTYLAVPVDDE